MAPNLFGFLRTRPRLAKLAVLVLLIAGITLAAYLGLQVHFPARNEGESVFEWIAFLASLSACLAVLLGGARIWGSFGKPADAVRPGQESLDE